MSAGGASSPVQGTVMRWSQNEWKENWLVVDGTNIRVFRNEENFTSGTHRPRIQMDLITSKVKPDATSARRFTIDDGAMLVYFRCAEQAQRDFWIKALSDASSKGHQADDYTLRRRERSQHLQPVGDFMLGELVGEGGYAKVKSGFSVKTGERVAAKIMLSSQREEHKREILTMSALKHRNIVELKDVIESGGHTYLIMELAKGGELFAKLCEIGRFTEDEARFYWQQLLQGVLYCHRKGLCHRDLKLENLLLDEKGEVLKITDFGFAKFQVDSMPKTILGTAVYVAPEVLEVKSSTEGYDGFLADVWSCGVILYTMIVGNYPFDLGYHGGVGKGNRRNPAIYELLTKAQYRLPSRATPELADMFSRIFKPNPSERASVVDLLRHPWTTAGKDPAEMDEMIAQMDEMMVHDEAVAQKLDAMGVPAPRVGGGSTAVDIDIALESGMGDEDIALDGGGQLDSLA